LQFLEVEPEVQTDGAFAVLPSSVGQAMSLGGYLARVERHEERHVMTIGECKCSVAIEEGKKQMKKRVDQSKS
jgi:hypothetical protein